MKVLLTGAFGNIGLHTLNELIEQGHQVRAFDLDSKRNRRAAQKYAGKADIQWGDVRQKNDLQAALKDQEMVIHLAFVIPYLSNTGINSEEEPELAREINVGGTQNLIQEMEKSESNIPLIFASSLHVYGRTQSMPPPRKVTEAVNPVEEYAKHKVECEALIKNSLLKWAILRLGAALPVRLIMDAGMFEVPLNNRIEYVHGQDAGAAFANAVISKEVWGKTLLIGGGKRCQYIYCDLMKEILDVMALGEFPDKAFTREEYSVDWLDTRESQSILNFQRRDLEDYLVELKAKLGWRLPFIRIFKPAVRAYLLRQSPYYS